MKYLSYILTLAFLRLLSLLPKPVLYLISDLLAFLLSKIVRYRRTVIEMNLRNSFPELKDKEIRLYMKRYYRHLADLILENVVTLFYSKKRLDKMFRFENIEVLHEWHKKKRHIVVVTAHYNNWEWASPMAYASNYDVLAVYKPLRNKHFDKALIKARTRFGAHAIPMNRIGRALFQNDRQGLPSLVGMIADQSPIRQQIKFWTHFLNQNTPVFLGSEKLAVKFNAVVVFMEIRKPVRGVYSARFKLVTDDPRTCQENEITKKHTNMLEALIREDPAYWLWSHNRWKISYEEWYRREVEEKT